MASVFHLCSEAYNIKSKIISRYFYNFKIMFHTGPYVVVLQPIGGKLLKTGLNESPFLLCKALLRYFELDFAETDKKLFFSAVAIQRVWRGYRVRKMIRQWNEAATVIQKWIRGWLLRMRLPQLYMDYYYNSAAAYYNRKATIIQAVWRGYYVRTTVACIKTLLEQREKIELISSQMRDLIKDSFAKLRATSMNETYQIMEKVVRILFDRHHLLRTRMQEGVFSIHGSFKLSCIEKILRSFQFTDYTKQMHKENNLLLRADVGDGPLNSRFDLNVQKIKREPYERMLLP